LNSIAQPETPRSAVTSTLPDVLRAATWPLHAAVERTGVMRYILAGQFERGLYLRLLRNLAAVYSALEPLLARHAAHPWLAAIRDPALLRTAALSADLRDLGGDPDAPLAAATGAYIGRLDALDREAPHLLVAHAYVRYLGDLSGGQTLRRTVARTLGLAGSTGLHFYDFGDADAVAALSRAFRQGLASIPAEGQAAEELVAEAKRAFELHAKLFRELDPGPAGSAPARSPRNAPQD
jgi:heme oxygenase